MIRLLRSPWASGTHEDRPALAACLKALRHGDTLVIWKLDRLGRNLKHLVDTAQDLTQRGIGSLRGAVGTPARERTVAGLRAARARGRKGGRTFGLTKAQVRLAQAAMKSRDSKVIEICQELGGITRATLYRYVSPEGELRAHGRQVLQG